MGINSSSSLRLPVIAHITDCESGPRVPLLISTRGCCLRTEENRESAGDTPLATL